MKNEDRIKELYKNYTAKELNSYLKWYGDQYDEIYYALAEKLRNMSENELKDYYYGEDS